MDPSIVIEYERVLAELNSRWPENQIEPSLTRIQYLLSILGDPQDSFDVVHVAGTNGKTSTCRMIEGLLSEFGLNTGLTTSPHLHDVRERIRIYGQSIDISRFIDTFNDIEPFLAMTDAELSESTGAKLSYFETLTAMAFAAFAEAPIDVGVIETGLGGRWDATNVVNPSVVVITPIGLDHQSYLGDTIEEIAAEKAGIIKPGCVVVCGYQEPAALEIIIARAQEVGAALLLQGKDFAVIDRSIAVGGQVLSIRGLGGIYTDVIIALHGQHQANNAALAIAAVEAFFGAGVDDRQLDLEGTRAGLAKVTSPGRMEIVRRGPTIMVDAAHNPHGARALVNAIADEFAFDRLIVVLAMLADKDAEGFIEVIEPMASSVIVTQSISDRALPADDLFNKVIEIIDADKVDQRNSLADAIDRAIELADDANVEEVSVGILITGSVVTAAQARALLGKRTAS
ncbi:MAG: dihydrofolate synthetase/folylpolyglutamate synthetase folc [Actinomycetota bacterium]